MKKKKIGAMLIAAVMMVGTLPAYAGLKMPVGTVRYEDFSGLVSDDASSFKGDWHATSLSHTDVEALNFDAETGVFGKAQDDKSLHIWNDTSKTWTGTNVFQRVAFDENASNEATALKVDTNGVGWKMTFDFAHNGTTRKLIQGASWSANSSGTSAWDTIFYVNGDGSYGVMNNTLIGASGSIAANKWHNVEIRIIKNDGNNYFELYINGELKKSMTTAMSNKWKGFQGFKWLQIGQYVPDNNASQSDLWLDNFRVELIKQDATVTEKTMDFDGANIADKNSWRGDYSFVMNDCTGGKSASVKTDIVDGAMGRAKGDKSLYIYNDPNVAITSTDNQGFIDVRADGYVSLPVSVGKWHKNSFSMAFSNNELIDITAFFNGDSATNWDKGRVWSYIKVVNGAVQFSGNATTGKVEANKFYKFDIVTYSGEKSSTDNKNKVRVYLDNELIYSNDAYVPTTRYNQLESFSGIYKMCVGGKMFGNGVGSTDALREFWLDDLSMSVHDTEPTFTEVDVNSSNAEFSKYMTGDLNLYVDSNAVWDNSFVDENAPEDEAAIFVAKKADGTALNEGDAIDGICYYSVTSGGSTLYGKMIDNVSRTAIDEKFDDSTDGSIDAYWDTNMRNYTTYTYPAGVGGRAADDKSMMIKTTGYDKDYIVEKDSNYAAAANKETYLIEQGAPYLYLRTTTQSWTTKYISLDNYEPTHFEYSILLDGDDWYELRMRLNTEKGEDFKAVSFKQNGTVCDKNGNTVGYFNKGQWTKVEASVYPATAEYIVKINGKQVIRGTYNPYNSEGLGNSRIYIFRLEQLFDAESGVSKSGVFCLDDFRAYQGSYQAQASIDDLKLSSDSNDVYNDGGAIVIDEEVDTVEFDITAEDGQTIKYYTDSTLSAELEEFDYISDGNVIVLTDGNLYKYYQVRYDEEKQPSIFELNDITDSKGNSVLNGVSAGTVDFVFDIDLYKANMPVYPIVAQYTKDGVLIKIRDARGVYNLKDSNDAYSFGKKVKLTVPVDVENIADSYIKLMVWDDQGSLKPYTGASSPIKVTTVAE